MLAEESFWDLFYSLPHWEFEIFLMIVFDVLFAWAIWRPLKRYITKHHKTDIRDTIEAEHDLHDYSENVRLLELENAVLELRRELALIDRKQSGD